MTTAHDYLDAIVWRARKRMEPADFEPAWGDRPRKSKYYPGVESMALPVNGSTDPAGARTLQDGLYPGRTDGRFDLPLLADMLRHSYGLLGRRLAIHANADVGGLPAYAGANWHRGTASGGGLYPVSVYWASGPGASGLPGLHYYSTTHHAMQRLVSGDITGEVRAALGNLPDARDTDQFLVLGVKFWQNAFKYNSFSYHAVTMDVGTVIQTWRMWAAAHGLLIRPALWFDDSRLGRLVSEQPDVEGMFAVVPLPWNASGSGSTAPPPRPTGRALPYADRERSRRVLTFDTVTTLHRATMRDTPQRPPTTALDAAATLPVPSGLDTVALPPPMRLDTGVRAALRNRRSSFGRFTGANPIGAEQLSAVLAAARSAARFDCDVSAPDGLSLVNQYVFASHVRGVPPGVYAFDPDANALRLLKPGGRGDFLQRNYFLENYNVEQAGAVVVPTVRAAAVLDAVGDRGYRLTNAVIGAVSQAFYTTASAVGLGGGVALGFDNMSYVEELGLADRGEAPFLIMMLGNERARTANFHYELG